MKVLTLSVSLFAATLMAGPLFAEAPGDGKRDKNAAADRADSPRRIDGPRRAGANRPSPAEMAKRMMEQFDKDGDQKLDSTELVAALTFVQERMSGRRGVRPGNAGDVEARRRGQRRGDGDKKPGGDRPKRPDAE